jgi:hypothetical protein
MLAAVTAFHKRVGGGGGRGVLSGEEEEGQMGDTTQSGRHRRLPCVWFSMSLAGDKP